MGATILITGASGNVGAELVTILKRQGVPIRIAVRPGGSTTTDDRDNVQRVTFDFEQPATFAAALAGVKRMFLIRPPAISHVRRWIFPAIDAAITAGVEQIVFLSLLGADTNRFVPHASIERYLLQNGVPYTFLRPSFFMQNLNTAHRQDIARYHDICVPAGDGATSFVDVRDIAAVAALALTEPGHTGRAYNLTGSQALSYSQVAAELSEVLGRSILYRRPSLRQFFRRQRELGASLPKIAVMSAIYTTARLGLSGRLTGDTGRLLNRQPIQISQYIKDYRHYWVA